MRQDLTPLQKAMHLSYVPRWGIVAMDRHQSVAEHSYRTTMIFLDLSHKVKVNVDVFDVYNVLIHDAEEAHTGDRPATEMTDPVSPEQSMTQFERLLKIADVMEAYSWYLLHGHRMQRTFIVGDCRSRLAHYTPLGWGDAVRELLEAIVPGITPGEMPF